MELVIQDSAKLLKYLENIKVCDCKEDVNKLLNKDIIRNNGIDMSYENYTITSESEKKIKQTINFNLLIANNILTANLLVGNTLLDDKVTKINKNDCKKDYVHHTFLHIPNSFHFLSCEMVYENNGYKTYYVKLLDGFVTVKD